MTKEELTKKKQALMAEREQHIAHANRLTGQLDMIEDFLKDPTIPEKAPETPPPPSS